MQLIGLNGRKRCGKDTAFHFIREAAEGLRVERICFADKMKWSGVRALGFDPKTMAEAVELADEIKEFGMVSVNFQPKLKRLPNGKWFPQLVPKTISGREFWQRYGTEAHRDVFGQDFWVDQLLPQPAFGSSPSDAGVKDRMALERMYPEADVLVETTTRFPNEAERILDLGGTVWWIDAETRLGPLPPDSHVSEHPLPAEYVTLRVPNNTTLEQFQVAIRTAYELVTNDSQ